MLNEALRILRVFKGIEAKDLAKQLGISPGQLSEIEKGIEEPSLSLIMRFAEILTTTPSSILAFSEELQTERGSKHFSSIVRKKTIQFLKNTENEQK
jgi:transcriptional regulator with XRE-family HTH domain